MADFCTVSDVEEVLQIEIADAAKVASVERAITEASAAIRNYTHQYIEQVVDDEETFDVWEPRYLLMLSELPVTSVSSVVEDEKTLTAGEDYVLAGAGQLLRGYGGFATWRTWAIGPQIVTVTYTHGYSEIPDDIVAVCARAASRGYQAGLKAAETGAVLGVRSMSLGDYSVGYGSEQGGGVGEGVMGVSAARMLLLSEKDILDNYRHKI